jgi:hypothetical protein
MCSEALKVGLDPANTGFDLANWLAGGGLNAETPANSNTNNVVVTGADVPGVVIDGGVGTRGYLTSATLTDVNSNPVFDQAAQLYPVGSNLGGIFKNPTYLGGANAGDDWLAGWAVGLDSALNP